MSRILRPHSRLECHSRGASISCRMHIYWLNSALTLSPDSDQEREALALLFERTEYSKSDPFDSEQAAKSLYSIFGDKVFARQRIERAETGNNTGEHDAST